MEGGECLSVESGVYGWRVVRVWVKGGQCVDGEWVYMGEWW